MRHNLNSTVETHLVLQAHHELESVVVVVVIVVAVFIIIVTIVQMVVCRMALCCGMQGAVRTAVWASHFHKSSLIPSGVFTPRKLVHVPEGCSSSLIYSPSNAWYQARAI